MREVVFQKGVLIKLFYNKELQNKYLEDMLPLLFTEKRKVIAFIMKELHNTQVEITIENILLAQQKVNVKNFINKVKQTKLTKEELHELFDSNVTSKSPALFKEAYETLHDETFYEFTERYGKEFTYDLAYSNRYAILARARAIIKVYDILYRNKFKNREDGIKQAVAFMRAKKTYLPTFSVHYNSRVGGFSRGFAATVMGKPSHTKSTLMTFESLYLIDKELVSGKIAVLSAEEPEEIFWRRALSAEYKIPMHMLRSGEYEISDHQVERMVNKYKDKLNFFPVNTLNATVDTLFTLKDYELIWLDHVNALTYPKGDMNQGIGTLVSREKEYLSLNKETAIVNLSQVNTKRMLSVGRLVAQKEDAFGSSYLEQAAREMITVYYPYVDATSEGIEGIFRKSKYAKWTPTQLRTTVEMHVQKNSFGDKPTIALRYFEEMGRFEDTDKLPKGTNVILPEPDKGASTLDMFKDLS